MTFIMPVTSKGQMVIPKPIRDALDISRERKVIVELADRSFIVEPLPTLDEMIGSLKTSIRLSGKELRKAIKEAAVESALKRYTRSLARKK